MGLVIWAIGRVLARIVGVLGSVHAGLYGSVSPVTEASFAGLQDTYLWVRGEQQVIDRVRACWASLYNNESISYRRRLQLPEQGLGIGVVV